MSAYRTAGKPAVVDEPLELLEPPVRAFILEAADQGLNYSEMEWSSGQFPRILKLRWRLQGCVVVPAGVPLAEVYVSEGNLSLLGELRLKPHTKRLIPVGSSAGWSRVGTLTGDLQGWRRVPGYSAPVENVAKHIREMQLFVDEFSEVYLAARAAGLVLS